MPRCKCWLTTLDWSDYVGRIAVGRIYSGTVRPGLDVALMQQGDQVNKARITTVYTFEDLGRTEVESADAGDIVALVGLENIEIGDTISDPESPRAMPRVVVDEPTLKMTFGVNTSPLAGQDGRSSPAATSASGFFASWSGTWPCGSSLSPAPSSSLCRPGILHLSVLIETDRREGYELSVGKPQVILHDHDGTIEEPFESLVIESPRRTPAR